MFGFTQASTVAFPVVGITDPDEVALEGLEILNTPYLSEVAESPSAAKLFEIRKRLPTRVNKIRNWARKLLTLYSFF